jgi:hypothetical protein
MLELCIDVGRHMNCINTSIILVFSTADTVTPDDPELTVGTCNNYRLFATSTVLRSSSIFVL